MPELPEVETVCRSLRNHIINKQIISCEIYETKCIKNCLPSEFKNKILNQSFKDVKRRGKHIILVLEKHVIISHLRMEGKYFYLKNDEEILMKHILLTFFLSDGHCLNYHDTRRFGTFHIFSINEYEDLDPIKKLGKEPFDVELLPKDLFESWHKRRKPIKSILLEQNLIVGIGNIYADEILFDSQIHPLTPAIQLTLSDCEKILKSAKKILTRAIDMEGTTVSSYSSDGIHGKFQNELLVYHRQKMPCKTCGTIIEQIKIGGRSTHYCPKCQKFKKPYK